MCSLIVVGILCVILAIIALCRAAKNGDETQRKLFKERKNGLRP